MKKKTIYLVTAIVFIILLSCGLGFGILHYIRNKNVQETGNILGVKWYNETDLEFTINTAEELYEFARLSDFYTFEGQTIYLGADIVVNEGNAADWKEKAPDKRWTPISGFAGYFDGQGHSISGLYGKGYNTPMALFTESDYNCVIQDTKLLNSYFETKGGNGTASFVSQGGAELYRLYSDAIINHRGENSGGIASTINAQTIMEECWFDGSITTTDRACGGIIAKVENSRVTMKHCLFSGEIHQTYTYGGTKTAGLCGTMEGKATLVMDDSLSCGTIDSSYHVYTGAMLGSMFAGSQLTVTNTFTSRDTHDAVIGGTSGSYSQTGNAVHIYGDDLIGEKAYQWTNLDFQRYWTITKDDTPVLRCFADKVESVEGLVKEVDISWYDANVSTYTITTREQLYGLAYLSASNDFSGKIINLGADIVVNNGKAGKWEKTPAKYRWYPIGDYRLPFAGIFDGQGHTISGIYLNDHRPDPLTRTYSGLFGRVGVGSTLKNFQLKNSYFERMVDTEEAEGYAFLGSIAGELRGTLDSVYSDAILRTDGSQVGGLVARLNFMDKTYATKVTVNNCWFDGKILGTSSIQMGGIAGYVGRSGVEADKTVVDITHCLNTGYITNTREKKGDRLNVGQEIGGILGFNNAALTINMEDCLNAGLIETKYDAYVGSLMGRLKYKDSTLKLNHVYVTEECYTTGADNPLDEISGTVVGGTIVLPEDLLTGIKAYQFSELNFKTYWSAVESGTPELRQFASKKLSVAGVNKMVDTSWYSADKKTLVIDSLEDLYGFYEISTYSKFEGQTIKLDKDIVVNEGNAADWATNAPLNKWYPIGSFQREFLGTFDGQGHTISGVYLSDSRPNPKTNIFSGLFGRAGVGSVIKNFRLENSYFERMVDTDEEEGYAFLGSIAGETKGVIDSVYSNAILSSDGNQIGGIVGRLNYMDKTYKTKVAVNNCWFDGKILGTSSIQMGGIAGYVGKSGVDTDKMVVDITHCLNTGYITNTRVKKGDRLNVGQEIGGILGFNNAAVTINMEDCLNAGHIDMKYDAYVGSIMGRLKYKDSTLKFTHVYVTEECYTTGAKNPIDEIKGTVIGGTFVLPEELLSGMKAYQFSELDFKTYWSVVESGTPELRQFTTSTQNTNGVKRMVDTSWYNQDKKTVTIDSLEDLYGFYEVSTYSNFEGQTIKLNKDIVMNKGNAEDWATNAPANKWYPIGSYQREFLGTFDGQGHTISGVYLSDSRPNPKTNIFSGLFGRAGVGSVIKNFRLENSYFERMVDTDEEEGYAFLGSIAGETKGVIDSVYSNAILSSDGNQIGGIVGRLNYMDKTYKTKVAVNNCWFDGKILGTSSIQMGGIAGYVGKSGVDTDKMVVDITHCLNTGYITNTRVKKGDRLNVGQEIGGILGFNNAAVTINMEDCLNAGHIDVKYNAYVGSVMGRLKFKDSTLKLEQTYVTKECYTTGAKNPIDEITGIVLGEVIILPEEMMTGIKAYQFSELDFKEYWSVVEDNTPELQEFTKSTLTTAGYDKMMDTSWLSDASGVVNDEVNDPYILEDAADLYGLAYLSQSNNFEGKTIILKDKIVVNEGDADDWGETPPTYQWYPIGSVSKPFAGTFDGQGKSISGLWSNGAGEPDEGMGLFGGVNGGTIQNVSLVNSYITGNTTFTGSIVGFLSGTISNVYSDAYVTSTEQETGGLVGRFGGGGTASIEKQVMSRCWFDGTVEVATPYVGGLIGRIDRGYNGKDIVDCLNTGDVISTYNGSDNTYAGGLVGAADNALYIASIKNSVQAGDVTITRNEAVGSVIGFIKLNDSSTNKTFTFQNVYTTQALGANNNNNVCGVGNWGSVQTIHGEPIYVSKADITGENAYVNTDLAFFDADKTSNAWGVVEDETLVLKELYTGTVKTGLNKQRISLGWYFNNHSYVNTTSTNSTTMYTISKAKELWGLAKLVNGKVDNFAGKTVLLGDKLTLNTGKATDWAKGDNTPSTSWIPIGDVNNAFAGIFDGQGKSIIGLWSDGSGVTGEGMGLFGGVNGGTIQNVSLLNSCVKGVTPYTGSIVGFLSGNVVNVYSDAHVTSTGQETGGIAGRFGGGGSASIAKQVMSGCWFDGTVEVETPYVGGLIGRIDRGYNGKEIIDCLNTGDVISTYNGSGSTYAGGLVGAANNALYTGSIKNSLHAGTVTITRNEAVGAIIGFIKLSDSSTNKTFTFENVYTTQELGATNRVCGVGNWSSVQTIHGEPMYVSEENVTGENAYIHTDLAFYDTDKTSNVWGVVNEGTPVLKCLYTGDVKTGLNKQRISLGWYYNKHSYVNTTSTNSTTAYTISKGDELYGMAKLVNDKVELFQGKTVTLTEDITLNEGKATTDGWKPAEGATAQKWTPIGKDVNHAFAGTFDGQGHVISGLYLSDAQTNSYPGGLFGVADYTSEIKNFKLTNSYLKRDKADSYVDLGSVIGQMRGGKLSNVYSDAIVTSNGYYFGGLVGRVLYINNWATAPENADLNAYVDNCWFDGEVLATGKGCSTGGIIGTAMHSSTKSSTLDGTVSITNCLNSGKISCEATATDKDDAGHQYIGGIIGRTHWSVITVNIQNCLNTGKLNIPVEAAKSVGSIMGAAQRPGSVVNFQNTYATTESYTTALDKNSGQCKGTVNGEVTTVAEALITGDKAQTPTGCPNLFGTDTAWETVPNKTPVLKYFATWWLTKKQ